MTAPEIELPDGVWDKAMAAKESVRYVDHPDNHQAVYGMSRYAVRAMLAAAFAAGRESAYTRDEWRVVAGPNEFPIVFQDEISSEEHLAIVLRDARNRWRGEVIRVQHRRTGATEWQRVAEAGGSDAQA